MVEKEECVIMIDSGGYDRIIYKNSGLSNGRVVAENRTTRRYCAVRRRPV